MAFCNRCGAQLEGDGRFCVKCGADQTAKAAGAPAAVAPAPQVPIPPQPSAFPQQPVQPFAGMPPQYPPPHAPIPVMAVPPTAPPKGNHWLWIVIIGGALAYGGYYYNQHNQQQTPGQAPAPEAQPGTPTPQGQPGPQAQTPGPEPQPGAQAPGGDNQALVQAQQFAGRFESQNGYIEILQAQWRNGANVAIQSAALECVQVTQTGQTISQMQTTLNGPAQPGQTIVFPTFQMGAVAQGVAKVNCGIVGVTPVN